MSCNNNILNYRLLCLYHLLRAPFQCTQLLKLDIQRLISIPNRMQGIEYSHPGCQDSIQYYNFYKLLKFLKMQGRCKTDNLEYHHTKCIYPKNYYSKNHCTNCMMFLHCCKIHRKQDNFSCNPHLLDCTQSDMKYM